MLLATAIVASIHKHDGALIMTAENLVLVDESGKQLAQLAVTGQEDGWTFATLVAPQFPAKLRESLEWYDEVVEHQMLSFLDSALASIDRFELRVRYPDATQHKVYSLHVNRQNEVSFRVTPVPPPAWQAKSESA
jgi:hypothetical protein